MKSLLHTTAIHHTALLAAYMIYITNAKARINNFIKTASCRKYRLFVAHNL